MKKLLLLVAGLLITAATNAQIKDQNWLLGLLSTKCVGITSTIITMNLGMTA